LNKQMRDPPGKSNGGSTLKPPASSIDFTFASMSSTLM